MAVLDIFYFWYQQRETWFVFPLSLVATAGRMYLFQKKKTNTADQQKNTEMKDDGQARFFLKCLQS